MRCAMRDAIEVRPTWDAVDVTASTAHCFFQGRMFSHFEKDERSTQPIIVLGSAFFRVALRIGTKFEGRCRLSPGDAAKA
jgi:hypothetical protein